MFKTLLKSVMLFVSLFSLDCSSAQDIAKRIDSLFNAVTDDKQLHFSGAVVVAENGRIIYRNALGYANADKQMLNTGSTAYSLASLSKIFTAVAVMQLKVKHKLNLDDAVAKYLPEFPFPAITIRQVLSHTSGLPDFEVFQSYTKAASVRQLSVKDIIPALKNGATLVSAPGTEWHYSNIGFGLLALLVEHISQKPFARYIQDNICKPAGLKNTYIDAPGSNIDDPARAISYLTPMTSSAVAFSDALKRDMADPIQTIVGPGLVVSSIDDLLRFDAALYDDRLLNAATREEMFTPVTLKNKQLAELEHAPLYNALGWGIDIDSSAGKIASHTGGSPGISTIMLRNLSRKQTVIVLQNTENPAPMLFGINAMNILNNRPFAHFRTD